MLNKKKIITSFIISFTILSIKAQDLKKEDNIVKSKMETFSSNTGILTKFIDTELPELKGSFRNAKTRIRKITSSNISTFYYQIIIENEYNNIISTIEYSDLIEIIKAIKELKLELNNDSKNNSDYLENKFTTNDGFQVGYYISKEKTLWYVNLEKIGSKNTLYFNYGDTIYNAFVNAKIKIEEIK